MKKNLSAILLAICLGSGPVMAETEAPAIRWFDTPERGAIVRAAKGPALSRPEAEFLPLSSAPTHPKPAIAPAEIQQTKPSRKAADTSAAATSPAAATPSSTASSSEMDEVLRARHIYEIFAAH